ncbi:MAG TPA: dTMP kinase [Erysipelothrix sp.]|nr:dTMP kinase [Erysipelothrix sp.]
MKGLFISFEGIDGSGKSTITQEVYNYFINKNEKVMLTREPGGNKIAEKIREIILDVDHDTMDDRTEALLYAASRRQHLIEKILPALKNDTLVLCDRFVDSSIAYQGYGRGIGAKEVLDLNLFAIEDHMPDMTFFLDVDVKTGLSRIGTRNELDRLEQENIDFFHRIYDGYQRIIKDNPRIIVIDGTQSIEDISQEIIKHIERRLNDDA